MTIKTALSESLEDYLEVILQLQDANKVARAKEISEKRFQLGNWGNWFPSIRNYKSNCFGE